MHVFGFFSELRNIVNALAWFGPFVLDTSKWIGNYRNGLFDYLDCKDLFMEKNENNETNENNDTNIIHIGRQTKEQFQYLVSARCMCEINGDIMGFFARKMEVCKRIWRITKPALLLELFILEVLSLPNNYISVHIRRGDNAEFNTFPISDYTNEINKHECPNIFLMTDDERIIPELEAGCPNKKIFYYKKNMTGWDEGTFYDVKPFDKYMHILHLIAEIDICRRSVWHIGTRSNVTQFLRFIHNNFDNFTIVNGCTEIV